MCEYCENRKELKSNNFCGTATMSIIGNSIDIQGDNTRIKWLKRVYEPRFSIHYCPMCGRKLSK